MALALAGLAATVIATSHAARADELLHGVNCNVEIEEPLHGLLPLFVGKQIGEYATFLGVSFENDGNVALNDVRVHYQFLDAFGGVVDELDAVWSGSFAPGVLIDFTHPGSGLIKERPLIDFAHVKALKCWLTGARWADGTVRTYVQNDPVNQTVSSAANTVEPPAPDITNPTNSSQTSHAAPPHGAPSIEPPTAGSARAVLLDITGTGIRTTQSFQAPDTWAITWSYNCAGTPFPQTNFGIFVFGDVHDIAANGLGASGQDLSYEHSGGSVYLKIISACPWHVRVVSQ